MLDRPRVSVCMAAYNGVRYIGEQIDSILPELADDDELVIVDDGSTDGTRDYLATLTDPRIRVVLNEKNLGFIRNFEKGMSLCTGDAIFLSDQDDLWVPGRVNIMLKALQRGDLVLGNVEHFGQPAGFLLNVKVRATIAGRRFRSLGTNLLGTRLTWGCAMAMNRRFLELALPIPSVSRGYHDAWFDILAIVARQEVVVADILVRHRVHAENHTPGIRLNPLLLARSRWFRLLEIVEAFKRVREQKQRTN